ncbi:hypothetical protein P153DRAFT_363421 [Dothidotthia symphoricarpi CBS 119687]|uniref:Uncharacterized protein n=1 Tax=Dothidotthia symphoricarpi CBS 119687 TaxID=1392245 RepID=A0A6A6AQT6_9PLEO|nr:uncharacterized protein P153DRAFT_363421 [Dothidotthia symphoricarpi CBS 119687]KAF2133207.1 hypothetical protein P153DRAFT_363421 [Dothidotthia symphoricarpi CBS 119687]
MRKPPSYIFLLLTFLSYLSLSLAAFPTSFCKCTCFGNSTIVALDAPVPTKPASHAFSLKERASKKTCNDCNRQFCLGYSFCTGEKEENVFTACFQRDSAKDQAVVFVFIAATVGLLSWAAVKPWVEQWRERSRERQSYIPVSGQGDR